MYHVASASALPHTTESNRHFSACQTYLAVSFVSTYFVVFSDMFSFPLSTVKRDILVTTLTAFELDDWHSKSGSNSTTAYRKRCDQSFLFIYA